MLPVATPLHRSVVVVQHLGGGEAGEDLYAQAFSLLASHCVTTPSADDVAAFVVQAVGHQPVGRAPGTGFAQEQHVVTGDGLLERRTHALSSWGAVR
jgi:hypothetical protein